jgi:hypothetical protein
MQLRIFLAIAASSLVLNAGISSRLISLDQIPPGISLQGKPLAAAQWADATGEYPTPNAEDDGQDAEIYAAGYRQHSSAWEQVWKVWDHIEDCQEEIICNFVKGSLEITDLDSNGKAEVSFVYRLACVGGVDQWDQKLFLVEDGRKYPLRGWIDVHLDDQGHYSTFSKWTLDAAYNRAPASFKAFAIKKWKRFEDQRQPNY